MSTRVFLDTNVLVYAYSADVRRSPLARPLVTSAAVISVQVCNEFVAVARRKLGMSWEDIGEALSSVRSVCGEPIALTVATADLAFRIAQSDKINIYDANIVAAAQLAGCKTLYTEDMQDGHRFGPLTVRNPFTG